MAGPDLERHVAEVAEQLALNIMQPNESLLHKQLSDLPASRQPRVMLFTVDPERDTREVLSQYVPWFDPSFLGLYGSAEETAAVAKEYRVFYAKKKSEGALGYTLDHWAGAYAYDPAVLLKVVLLGGKKEEDIDGLGNS